MNACATTNKVFPAVGPLHAQAAAANAVKQYLIFSQSEAEATTIREGFWSNVTGWGDFSAATRFTAEERNSLDLPVAASDDAVWVDADQLQSFFAEQQARVMSAGGSNTMTLSDVPFAFDMVLVDDSWTGTSLTH